MATDVTTRPQYLNANNLIYTFWDLRRYMDGDPPGPGAADYESFRVLPRQAGVNLSVDVGKTAVGLMQAWVRGSTRDGQGLYRIDNIDVTAPSANTYLAQLNVAVTSNASGNPRLDQVVLVIADAQHAGATNKAYIDVIAGTPTAAATLDNRNGASALPASCILLADILLASGDATVDAVDIRDRRISPLPGSIFAPPAIAAFDAVTLLPNPSVEKLTAALTNMATTFQGAVSCYLPRRIKAATKIRWTYVHGGTAMTGNYVIGIYDPSGRKIIDTGSVAYTGALNTTQVRSETITAQDFEPGNYWVLFGHTITAGGANGLLCQGGGGGRVVSVAGQMMAAATGSAVAPQTIGSFADLAAGNANVFAVPQIALSVT